MSRSNVATWYAKGIIRERGHSTGTVVGAAATTDAATSCLMVVHHLRCSNTQRDGVAAVPLAEGLLKWYLHLLQRAEDNAAPPRREEDRAQHGEKETASSAVKAS
jgi:hypothetical protein